MKYNFKFKLSKIDIWQSSIYYTIFSVNGIFNVLFTLAAWAAGIYLLVSGKISVLSDIQKILIFFCAILFPIISPILIWLRVSAREKVNPQKEVELEIGDDGLNIIIEGKKGHLLWEQIYKIKKRPTMLLFMMDTLHGFILPKSVLGNNDKFGEVYQYSKEKHNEAREVLKKENRPPKPLTPDQEVNIDTSSNSTIDSEETKNTSTASSNKKEKSLQELANLAKNLDNKDEKV